MPKDLLSATKLKQLEAPMCVNVVRLQDYRLAPDEVMLFDWLLVKQAYVFHFKSFYYSQRRVERETRIGRRRFETIVQHFKEQEWLWSEVRPAGIDGSAVRHYLVDYDKLSARLDDIVRYESATYAMYKDYFAEIAPLVAAARRQNADPATDAADELVREFENAMQINYRRAVECYNSGQMTGNVPERQKVYVQLPIVHAHRVLLQRLLQTYDMESLRAAFSYYVVGVMREEYKPKNIVGYFLTCNQVTGDFPVVAECLNNATLLLYRPR